MHGYTSHINDLLPRLNEWCKILGTMWDIFRAVPFEKMIYHSENAEEKIKDYVKSDYMRGKEHTNGILSLRWVDFSWFPTVCHQKVVRALFVDFGTFRHEELENRRAQPLFVETWLTTILIRRPTFLITSFA